MNKKSLVLLIVFFTSFIYSMKLAEPLECSISLLSQDVSCDKIQPLLSLQEISRLKRSSKWCNQLYDVEKVFHQDKCWDYCIKFARNYYTCTKALGHFAQKNDEAIFKHLWAHHAKVRHDNIVKILGRSTGDIKDQMKVYRKHYNTAKRVRKKLVKCAVEAINNSDAVSANIILSGGSLSIFDLLKYYDGIEKIFKDNSALDFVLYHACQLGNADLIKALCGGTVDDRSFRYIIDYADALLMYDLVDKDVLLIDSVGYCDKTVLHYAAEKGFERVIEIVLGKGAYVNCRDVKGMTPLHYAIKHARVEAVKMLLTSQDADVRFTNNKGKRAIDYGVPVNKHLLDDIDIKNDKKAICKLLKSHLEKRTACPYSYAKIHSNGYQKIHHS